VSRVFLAALALAALLALTAAPSLQAAVVVKAVASDADPYGYAFRPKRLEVGVGTRVTWKAVAGFHDVTSTSKNWSKSSSLSIGDPTSFTFRKTGTFRYRCTIHSSLVDGACTGQCGKVVVTG
jgi:plastocyanin